MLLKIGKNKRILKSYKEYTIYLLSNITDENHFEKINAINKIHKILLSSIQKSIFENLIQKNEFFEDSYFFDPSSGQIPFCRHCCNINTDKLISTLDTPIKVFLNSDPILSFPWNKNRLKTLEYISYRTNNQFKHDPSNHCIMYFYPINIFLVENGMHSLFSGLYDLSQYTFAQQIINIEPFYKEYYFDGTHFRHSRCNKIINTPKHIEIGILYELGRIYLDKKIDFKSYYHLAKPL